MPSTDLALLVPLDALLQEVSVTRAARRLGLSTPAMSHALARMRGVDAALATALSRFKLPKEYWVVPALPRTSLDKIARSRLQALGESSGTTVLEAARLRTSGSPR